MFYIIANASLNEKRSKRLLEYNLCDNNYYFICYTLYTVIRETILFHSRYIVFYIILQVSYIKRKKLSILPTTFFTVRISYHDRSNYYIIFYSTKKKNRETTKRRRIILRKKNKNIIFIITL